MKGKSAGKRKKKQDFIILLIVVAVMIILLSVFPKKQRVVYNVSSRFFLEMVSILPAIMILMGLFNVFIPEEVVVKYLGKSGGTKAILIGIFLGALPTGPLYVAFPMASTLLKKGARISCVVAFLSAWACIKVPQEMVELQFLGLKFMLARLVLTVFFVVIMGISMEWLIEWSEKRQV